MLVGEHVEGAEEVAHEAHDLVRRLRGRELGEAAEVRLRDGRVPVLVRELLSRGEHLQLLDHERRHQRVQDVLRALPRLLHGPARLVPGAALLLVLVRDHEVERGLREEEQLALAREDVLPHGPALLPVEHRGHEVVDVRREDDAHGHGQEHQARVEEEGVPAHEEEDEEHKVQRVDLVRRHVEDRRGEVHQLAVRARVAEDQRVVGDVDERDGHAAGGQEQRLGLAWVPGDPSRGLREVPPQQLDQQHGAAAVDEDGQAEAAAVEGVRVSPRGQPHHVVELEARDHEHEDGLDTEPPHDLVADHGLVEPLVPLPLHLRREALALAQEEPLPLGAFLFRLQLPQAVLEARLRLAAVGLLLLRGSLAGALAFEHALRQGAAPLRARSRPALAGRVAAVGLEGVGDDLALALHLHLSSELHLLREPRREVRARLDAELELAGQGLLHHARGRVDRVAEQPVARQLRADDAGDDRPRVHTHLELNLLRLQPHDVAPGAEEPVHEPRVAVARVLLLVRGQDADAGHVLLAHGLDLRDLVRGTDDVEPRELVVEKPEQLGGHHPASELVEVSYEDEEDRDPAHLLRDVRAGVLEHGRDDVEGHHVL
mmetsp:Transcript_108800/g.307652  ORF Transcript_108800/g.307652 Transcript_108800/m.307652 type:complete len:601 (+) Transcript_108800:640-2442(+)